MEKQRRMLTAKEVAERLGVSRSTAYSVIKALNAEMSERGCRVIAGRVSNEYFEQVYFDFGDLKEETLDVR